MIEAEGLNREAALLSNTLADFADEDVENRKPVVDKILDLRRRWRWLRYQIAEGKPHPDSLPRQAKETEADTSLSEAEIRVELQKIRVNISKYKKKITDNPDAKKLPEWEVELERLEAIREGYDKELIRLSYA